MEKNTFEILNGSTSIIKGYGYSGLSNAVTITDVTGWDEIEFDIQTAPKLNGNGSYIISERVGDRTIVATFNVHGALAAARGIVRALNTVALNKGQVTLKFTAVTGTTLTETMVGKVKTVKPTYGAYDSTLEVTILCPVVEKTVNNNGNISTTV